MNCTLCGLETRNTSTFCCPGCENVHAILVESGSVAPGQSFRDTELFREALKRGLVSNPSPDSAPPPDAETREAVFHVGGMWCNSCGWLIEHALTHTRGVVSAEVLFCSDLLKVRYCPQYLPKQRIAEVICSFGYRATEYTGDTAPADAERKDLLLRTGIAAFLSMNVMTFSLVVYASYFGQITSSFGRYIPFILMALATPSVFWCAAPVLRLAWGSLRAGILRMESLLALGILMAYGYSAVQAFRGDPHVYFDTACAIVTLVLAGKTIERSAKDRAARAITLLHRLMPSKARLMQDGRERFVSLDALEPGMIFVVKPGERIAADGVVVEGRSHADESVLTGESAPVTKEPGDSVVCGSVNTGSPLHVRATRVGTESTLARIVRTVEQASATRTGVERAVDRVSRVFIPVVLALAALTFAGWQWRTGHPADALMHALAVIVIACPCALGIATPLAVTSAVAAASRRGILVSDTRVLETIRGVDMVDPDNAGTATFGEFALLDLPGLCSCCGTGRRGIVGATNPIALKALGAARGRPARARRRRPRRPRGSPAWWKVRDPGAASAPWSTSYRRNPLSSRTGRLPVAYFGGTTRFARRSATACVPSARVVYRLHRRGIRTTPLSGDTRDATAGSPARSAPTSGSPKRCRSARRRSSASFNSRGRVVAMIGRWRQRCAQPGQADLGIALGSGADIAMKAAPLVLTGRLLTAVCELWTSRAGRSPSYGRDLFWRSV